METKASQIKKLLNQNLSFAKIAKIVGCKKEYVSTVKKQADNPKEKTYGNLKKRIKELYASGHSKKQIIETLNCAASTIHYSLSEKKRSQKNCSISKKLFFFKNRNQNSYCYNECFRPDENLSIFCEKISSFRKGSIMKNGTTPNKKNVLDKFSKNQNCGLCGDYCDFNNSKSYSFDHYIPRSRGGDNSLENMQLLCMQCNQMKHSMLQEEFLEKCRKIVEFNK